MKPVAATSDCGENKQQKQTKTTKQQTKSKQLGMKPVASLAATSHGGDSSDSL